MLYSTSIDSSSCWLTHHLLQRCYYDTRMKSTGQICCVLWHPCNVCIDSTLATLNRFEIHRACTWVVACDPGGAAKGLPQQRRVLLAVLHEHFLQRLRPVELVQDDRGCRGRRANHERASKQKNAVSRWLLVKRLFTCLPCKCPWESGQPCGSSWRCFWSLDRKQTPAWCERGFPPLLLHPWNTGVTAQVISSEQGHNWTLTGWIFYWPLSISLILAYFNKWWLLMEIIFILFFPRFLLWYFYKSGIQSYNRGDFNTFQKEATQRLTH